MLFVFGTYAHDPAQKKTTHMMDHPGVREPTKNRPFGTNNILAHDFAGPGANPCADRR